MSSLATQITKAIKGHQTRQHVVCSQPWDRITGITFFPLKEQPRVLNIPVPFKPLAYL